MFKSIGSHITDLMTKLKTLDVACIRLELHGGGFRHKTDRTKVPKEIGLLSNLKKLTIHGSGFNYDLASEITNLQHHGTHLDVEVDTSESDEDEYDDEESAEEEEEEEEEQ